ncbi:MAG: hypothetical protein HYV75_08265, partial [Opitutae bacterium]|nr:hypothetical protein [Opitutae bacterium]
MNTPPVPARISRRASTRLIPALFLAASLPLGAQNAVPAPAPATKEENEIVELSPFEVTAERDAGYAATNTLGGTRLNSAIANTPAALSVLTREFLDDIGAVDANRAIEYALNAGNDTTNATGNNIVWNPFSYSVRGIAGTTNSRNYFRSSFLGASYNVDYLELSRGPNSVLFG